MIAHPTVTVRNAGRSLPGLRPLRTVEAELRPHELTYGEAVNRIQAEEKGAEPKGLIEQGLELGAGVAALAGGASPKRAEKTGEEIGKNNPISADERNANKNAEAAVEETKQKVEKVEEWGSELSHLLSRGSLENLGKIIAGGLLLLIAVVLFVRAMGGPSPSIVGKLPSVVGG